MDEKQKTLHDLCETVSRELEEANAKIRKAGGKLSAGDVEYIDKLTHSLKSIKTTIAMMEAEEDDGGYSGRYMPYYGGMGRTYADGRMDGGRSYGDGMSYAGRRNARRDSMGRYSRDGGYSYADEMDGIKADMRELAQRMPEEHRRKIERALDDLR